MAKHYIIIPVIIPKLYQVILIKLSGCQTNVQLCLVDSWHIEMSVHISDGSTYTELYSVHASVLSDLHVLQILAPWKIYQSL